MQFGEIPRSNTGTVTVNTMKVKLSNLIKSIRIKYYQNENECQKIKSGKLFPF